MPFSATVSTVRPDCAVECVIPAHVACTAPITRLLARAGAFAPVIEPFEPESPEVSVGHVQFRCSAETATELVRQLCALRHTRARYDTQLLTACAEAVGVIQDALGEALTESVGGQFVPLG